jgi:hypothetical protein
LLRTRNISFMGSHLKRFERTAAWSYRQTDMLQTTSD